MSFRRAGCLAVLAVISVLSFTPNTAQSITIKPAAFDHIVASVPEEVMAGVEFEVAVTFVDRYGNLMAENWKPETSLTLSVSQAASVQPSILTPENYVPGFQYSVRTEKMGELTLFLRDDKGKVLDQWNLTIKTGRPVELRVDLPPRAEVGEEVIMSIQAVDAHGNIAYGYLPQAQSISLEDSAASVVGEIISRAGGVYELPIRFRAHGEQSVNLRDKKRGLSGSSASIKVLPAPLGSFDIKIASGQSVAGREFALTIRALDSYGNLVTDYGSRYKGVRLYSRDAQTAPDLIPPSAFSDGVARVGIVMRSAGEHTVKISELQSNISGDFSVLIVPAGVKNLRILTPDSAMAGEPFEIRITSEDEFGNKTSSIPPGSIVRLNSTGTGILNPNVIMPGAFKDGVAKLKVSYEKAESFEITASLEGSGKTVPAASPVDKKEQARMSAQKAREEAMRARRESRLMEKRVSEQTTLSSRPQAQAPAPVKRKPQVKKTAPVKTPESPSPVVANIRPLRPGILDRIAVVEDISKALITFSTNGMTDYNVTTSAKLSRKWIDIEFPDMLVELPDRIGGGEKIVGEVYVEPLAGDGRGVRVSIEILPTRIGYDVYQEGQSVVLKVTTQ
ncbi:MAG: hypothetical protein RRA15_06575 [bacterium]|nr:hypothetical protein [bacterium]MDT8366139.1 hypothetical protein [bacterium]